MYEFRNLLRVENQGTQTVEVYSEYSGEAFANLALIDDGGILREDPRAVDVGSVLDVGLYIDTHGSELGEETQTLEIVADQPD